MNKSKHTIPTTFSELLRIYALPLWKSITLLSFLSLFANLLAMLQPAILAAILASIIGGSPSEPSVTNMPFDLNYLGARVINFMGPKSADQITTLMYLGGVFAAQSVVVSGINYWAFMTAHRIRVESTRRIQLDLLRHLLDFSLGFFHKQKSGELMSRVTQDAQNTAVGLGPLARGIIHHAVQIVVYGIYLFSTSIWLTLGAVVLMFLQFVLTQFLKKPIRDLNRKMLDALAALSTTLQETFVSIRVAKSFGSEDFELEKLEDEIDSVANTNLSLGRIEKLEEPIRSILDSLASLGIFFIALGQLRDGTLSVEGLILYVYVGRLLIAPINGMATSFVWIQALRAAFDRIREIFIAKPQVIDGSIVKNGIDEKIELRNVCFSYDNELVLEDVSIEINRGEVIALVGPSGAGKSTLTDLILRLGDPVRGEILMDGVNLREFRHTEYRGLFGVVAQESLLFHDTVRNNILYGRTALQEEDVRRAARVANAHAFIMDLPHGYDTVVGDRGVRLSGGQRQRVAIARAIVSKPPILILDEATSALDSESEKFVQEAIDRVLENATAIVVAHRLSTIRHADKIVVLERGRIVDMGSHDELLERSQLYWRLCALQFGQRSSTQSSLELPSSLGALSDDTGDKN